MAYIDEVEERDGDKVQKVFYSVLVKGYSLNPLFKAYKISTLPELA